MALTKVSPISVVGTRIYFIENERLDMYFVHPQKIDAFEYLNRVADLKGFDVEKLWRVLEIPPESGRGAKHESGPVMVIKPRKLTSDFIVETNYTSWTTESEYLASEKGRLKNGDILLLSAAHAAGYIGRNTSIFFVENGNMAMCIGELIRVRPNKDKIDPFYLLGYLNTTFMRTLLKYSVRGQTVHLYPNDIRNLPVILPPRNVQNSIGEKLKKSIVQKLEAEKKKKEIEEIFAKYLPVDFDVPSNVSYTYNKKESHMINKRLDAHFYHPKYRYVIQLLKQTRVPKKMLGEIVLFSNLTSNPKRLETQKFKYVEIDNIDLTYGYIETHSEIEGRKAPSRARKVLKKNNLLISLTRPYRGAIAVVDPFYDDCIGTTGFSVSQTISEDIDVYYLCSILKTRFGIMQLEQRMSNANYPAVIESDLKDILVPILPDSERIKISENMKSIISLSRVLKSLRKNAMSELEQLLNITGGES